MMRLAASICWLIVLWVHASPARVAAQEAAGPWIQSVTFDATAGTATITGTGFTDTCDVRLDGHALTILPGGLATRLVALVPATLLASPGTYRLTVSDAGRRVGDAFEVTIAALPTGGADRAGIDGTTRPTEAPVLDFDRRGPQLLAPGEVIGARLVENIGSPYNAAFGYEALSGNNGGGFNTAGGQQALFFNAGLMNVALGFGAGGNAFGNYNILIGAEVYGTGESNTIRLGYPFNPNLDPDGGQNRTFIAGIRGTTVNGATPVGINAEGQLGMADRLGAGAGYGCDTCYQNGTIELYNPGTGDMTLQSGPAYRLLFNPDGGHVGIGVNSLLGAGAGYGCPTCYQQGTIELYNPGTGNLTIQGGSSYDLLLNPNGGHVGIGTTDALYPLHLGNGAYVSAGGVWTNASSRALKDHITPLTLDEAQDALVALAPVKYTYKIDPSEPQVGFIAEDVPDLVAQNDRQGLSPMDLVAVLTKVVQAQQALLTTQQAQLAALQAHVARLAAAR